MRVFHACEQPGTHVPAQYSSVSRRFWSQATRQSRLPAACHLGKAFGRLWQARMSPCELFTMLKETLMYSHGKVGDGTLRTEGEPIYALDSGELQHAAK